MQLDEVKISRAIIKSYIGELLEYLESDVAIVGGGPAGLIAAYSLAKNGIKTALFERRLAVGGGMWGGGAMFNMIVVQDRGKEILDQIEVRTERYEEGYYVADSVEAVTTLASKAVKAGAKIFNLMHTEDVIIKEGRMEGLVLCWDPVRLAKLPIDPVAMRAEKVIDATGHDCEIVRILQDKMGAKLNTETGRIMGERSMWADRGERTVEENAKEIFPNLYVTGLAATAAYGSPRMGPIFGGMLLSGRRVAELIIEELA